jgi:TolA-binding protein
MNKKVVTVISFIVLLSASHIVLAVKIFCLDTAINKLEKKTESFGISLVEFQKYENSQILKINDEIQLIINRQEENKKEIKNELLKINRKSDEQFSKTVVMSKTYDAILEEQKKKTIDTAEKDKAIIESKNNAIDLYKEGKYSAAYDEFNKLTEIFTDDIECRLYKAKSLYYKNRADSSSYAEILEDIKVLKQNGAADDEVLEIEKSILAEKEGFNE